MFVDDSPVEVAEVLSGCPGVTALLCPRDADDAQMRRYVLHAWPLDAFRVTTEDAAKTAMVRRELDRRREAR